MKVALIGASGQAGSRILKELVSRGHTVTAIAREVIRAVPETQREGMLALGATKWETVRGAVVQIENLTTLEVRSYITQRDGKYHFAELRTNVDYQVWAQRDDKRSSKKILNKYNSARRPVIDLELK